MSAVLGLRVRRDQRQIPESEWGWKSEPAVFIDMVARSGLREKTIAIEADIDASTLAKVKSGTARPSEQSIDLLMDATGSEAWLFYWLLKRGYDPRSLRKLETETETRARLAEEALAEERLKNRVLIEALSGRTA